MRGWTFCRVLEKKNRGDVGKNVATVCGDSVDDMKEGKEMDSSRERESIPALADPISRELSSSDGETSVEEESSDSLFSISIESTDHSYGGVIADKEVSSPVRAENQAIKNPQSRCFGRIDRAEDKCPGTVLNPVENLLPSRSPVGRATSPLKNHSKEENKENADGLPENILRPRLKLPDCILKPSSLQDSPQIRDISVDASLSSWLVESDSTPESQRSVGSFRYSPLRIMLA